MLEMVEKFSFEPQKPKLLIVDDQKTIILLLHELFKDSCEVFMATNGKDALSISEKSKPDLILLDCVMPDMDGYEVCRQLKSNPELAEIPVIFVTGNSEQAEEIKGFELGAVDYIHKPIIELVTRARVNTHLRLKQQSDLLKSMAMLDGLTQIANRRKFEAVLQQDWLQSARDKTPLSLLLMDIDYFKRFNDHYEHLAGDACLQHVAQTLTKVPSRPYDLVARYGGEEFVFILPNTDLKGAEHLATEVVHAIHELHIPHELSQHKLVSLSIGVTCTFPQHQDIPDRLIQEADKALYEAKAKGRNQIVSKQLPF